MAHQLDETQEIADPALADTVPLEALREELLSESTTEIVPSGGDPYHNAKAPAPIRGQRHQRRTLDDMRKLSEEIKQSRTSKPTK